MSFDSIPTAASSDFPRVRGAVLNDRAFQRRLSSIQEPAEFYAELGGIAEEIGYTLTADQARASMPPILSLFDDPGLSSPDPEDLLEWFPTRIFANGGRSSVEWCYVGRARFTQPFFEDTVRHLFASVPFSRMFRHRTSIDVLRRVATASPSVPPTGFIFHMSRCGSTLVSQMLAALSSNIVISEPHAADDALTLKPPLAELDARIESFKWIVAALGRKRFDDENNYFIKFDSWNTLDLDVIRSAYPDVPWVFLYRDPVEVIVSQMRRRGSQMIPGTIDRLLPGITITDALAMGAEEYCARALAKMCEAAIINGRSTEALFINYTDLPEVVATRVLDHFRVSYSTAELEKMQEAASFDAKSPGVHFEPDSEGKQREATDVVRRAAAQWVEPYYSQLEQMRAER